MRYILAIDQGTTSSRAIIYNERFENVGMAQQAFPQYYPKADWVEHEPREIWDSVQASISGALGAAQRQEPGFKPQQIVSIGITNQRETFLVWERHTGRPIGRAIVWQCRRSAEICAKLAKSASGKKIVSLTGLVLDPYFSGTKLKWLLDSDSNLRRRAAKGELAFGTIDTYLIWKLTRGKSHVTDVTNASRTLLMDLKALSWSPLCQKALGVPSEMLPKILDSDAMFGMTEGLGFLPDGIPIHGVLGDQQAALFGQECFSPGDAKSTYGTGAFLLLNTGNKPRKTKAGLSTVAWKVGGKVAYAVEGSVFIAGAAVQWLRDGLQLFHESGEVERLAAEVEDSDGVFMIPALSGLGSPYWAPHAKGLIGGLTRRSTKAHVARACLEGIAYSVADLMTVLGKDAGLRSKKLRVDGGAARNAILMQFQADLMNLIIQRPDDIESTARGAAYAAALGVGVVSSLKELTGRNPIEREFQPTMKAKLSAEKKSLWHRRVKALLQGCY